MSEIAANLQALNQTLHSDVKLIAVSKTKPLDMVREVYQAGQRDFGENKVQELIEKANDAKDLSDIRWHFIGHLQSNKINQLLKVPHLFAIHSIDSVSLLEKLLKKEPLNKIKIFLQVNTSGEEEKGGFTELDQLKTAALKLKDNPFFKLQGLMTIGKIRTDDFEADAKACFSKLTQLKTQIDQELGTSLELSMGMSSDYAIAQEMGSNWIRVGSKIFGNRT